MPIFEYVCQDCGKKFEALIIGSKKAECPSCHGQKLEQQLSSFSARSTGSSTSAMAPCGVPGAACGTGGGT